MRDGLRILLVDDEKPLLSLLQRHLERSGYEVRACLDAEVALVTALESGWVPDLLITDEILPGQTGTDLARKLLAKVSSIRCLLCSGYPLSLEAFAPEFQSRVRVLQKPYLPAMLEAEIRALTAGLS